MAKILDLLDRLIREHGSASILKDHLSLFRDQLVKSEDEKKALEEENGRLVEQCEKQAQELAGLREPEEYLEIDGVLARKVGGEYLENPYCPTCHGVLSNQSRGTPFYCTATGCGFVTRLKGGRWDLVIQRLRSEE